MRTVHGMGRCDVCTCVCRGTRPVSTWRPEVVTDYLASPLFFERGSPTEPRVRHFTWTGWPAVPGMFVFGPTAVGSQSRTPVPSFHGAAGDPASTFPTEPSSLFPSFHLGAFHILFWGLLFFFFFKSRHIYTFNHNEELAFLNKVLEVTKKKKKKILIM